MELPIYRDKDGYKLKIQVKTGSKKNGVEGIENDVLKIKLKSQPVDGLANRELLEILSELLGVPKSKIEIAKGVCCKYKIIKIKELPE